MPGHTFPARFMVGKSCIGELSQHVSMHVLILCNGEESGSEQNQPELESEKAPQPRVQQPLRRCGYTSSSKTA